MSFRKKSELDIKINSYIFLVTRK